MFLFNDNEITELYLGKPVITFDQLKKIGADYDVIITVKKEDYLRDIRQQLEENGIKYTIFIKEYQGENSNVFESIYRDHIWGINGDEKYYSGDGSHNPDIIVPYIEYLTSFIALNKIKSICEIGCGDFNVMKRVLQDNFVSYYGIDIVSGLINENKDKYSTENITFQYADATDVNCVLPEADLLIVRQVLQENNIVLIIKLHPFQRKETISISDYSNIVLWNNDFIYDNGMQINEILGNAAALISDYSSAAVDYLILNRPMAFTLDDVEDYENSRGFVFEKIKDWLPGKELYSSEDFMSFIVEIAEGIDSSERKRKKIRDRMHDFDDDKSCKRVLEALGI